MKRMQYCEDVYQFHDHSLDTKIGFVFIWQNEKHIKRENETEWKEPIKLNRENFLFAIILLALRQLLLLTTVTVSTDADNECSLFLIFMFIFVGKSFSFRRAVSLQETCLVDSFYLGWINEIATKHIHTQRIECKNRKILTQNKK